MPRMASLRKRLTDLIPELAKFGVVGLIGSVIDLGGADYLHVHMGIGPMVSKAISITAATIVTYLGSRFWTFRHRVNQALLREGMLFVVLNLIGLGIAEVVIATATYGLDLKSELAYNGASLAGTGFGTIFRYFSYKKWVFLAGAPGTVMAAGEAAVSGIVDPAEARPSGARLAGASGARLPGASGARLAGASGGYGPPWEELERPASLRYGPAWEHLEPAESDGWRR
jgi:putative flippase GtrA